MQPPLQVATPPLRSRELQVHRRRRHEEPGHHCAGGDLRRRAGRQPGVCGAGHGWVLGHGQVRAAPRATPWLPWRRRGPAGAAVLPADGLAPRAVPRHAAATRRRWSWSGAFPGSRRRCGQRCGSPPLARSACSCCWGCGLPVILRHAPANVGTQGNGSPRPWPWPLQRLVEDAVRRGTTDNTTVVVAKLHQG